jgi:hypothetical protein
MPNTRKAIKTLFCDHQPPPALKLLPPHMAACHDRLLSSGALHSRRHGRVSGQGAALLLTLAEQVLHILFVQAAVSGVFAGIIEADILG